MKPSLCWLYAGRGWSNDALLKGLFTTPFVTAPQDSIILWSCDPMQATPLFSQRITRAVHVFKDRGHEPIHQYERNQHALL